MRGKPRLARTLQQEAVPAMESERGERTNRDQGQLRLQEADAGILARPHREQEASGGHSQGKASSRDRNQNAHECPTRDVRPPAEQAQIQGQDGSDQQRDAEDVGGVGRGVEPARGAQGLGDGGALERD